MPKQELDDKLSEAIKNKNLIINRDTKMARRVRGATYEVNKRLRHFGDVTLSSLGVNAKKHMRVNPKKGELVNTIIHEIEHIKHPKMSEQNIRKQTNKAERKMSIPQQIKLLRRFTNARI